MSRRVVALTGDVWERLQAPCRTCLFWELGEAPRPTDDDTALVRKEAWTTTQVHAGRSPGRAILVDGELAGMVLFATADVLARPAWGVPRFHNDALVLATIWIDPVQRNKGLGRVLVQATIKEAIRRGLGAVEVRADRRWRPESCVLPITYLLHEGFDVVGEHLRQPLLRLDVARTLRWADTFEHAVDEVLERLPRRVARPVTEARVESMIS